MLTKNINFKNFKIKKKNFFLKNELNKLLKNDSQLIRSLSTSYKNKYNIKKINKISSRLDLRIIGIGGSILGSRAIYDFLQKKIKKKIIFIDDISKKENLNKKRYLNLIISKSGNTLETISNINLNINRRDKNLFITENKRSFLFDLANKLKSEIIEHNNYIGGRYSVLSEVGMLPAELMGLNPKKFRQLDNLVKNKKFLNSLIENVNAILFYLKNKKSNSVIINYNQRMNSFFYWYQQLVAESLGKKNKGLLPIISSMPKDNHSLMQLYLDGNKNNFYTFCHVYEKNTPKIKKDFLNKKFQYLKDNSINQIFLNQKNATEKVFLKKKIPFRTFEIKLISEQTLGELFCFCILETILLAKALKINPFDQPAVELIKNETKKFFI